MPILDQLAFYKITATTPTGTAKVRVQSSIGNGYMKFDGLSLRNGTGAGSRTASTEVSNVTEVWLMIRYMQRN